MRSTFDPNPSGAVVGVGDVNIHTIRLQVQHLLEVQRVTGVAPGIRPVLMTAVLHEVTRDVILRFQLRVAARKYATKTVSYPATWWDAFKRRWFPASWLRRWPVRFESVTMEACAYYPDIEVPGEEAFVDILHRVETL